MRIAIVRDITERKQAELDLKESEERLRLSTELGNVAVWEFDFRTNSMTRSKNHDKLYGLEIQEKWEFETFINATHPDDREFSNTIIQKSAKPGGPDRYKFDFRVVYPDQSIHWLMVTGMVIERNKNKEAVIVRGTLIDISDRKQAEMELLESQSFFEQLFIQSSTSTQLLDKDGWCVRINPKLSELFGVKPEDIEGKKYNIFKDGEIIRTGVIQHLKKVFENHETVQWEVNFDIQYAAETTGVEISKPEKKWFKNIAYPILSATGELMFVIVQHEDITKRVIAEDKIKESEANLSSLINNTNDAIWSLDTNFKYVIFNKAYAGIFYSNYGFEVEKGMDARKQLNPEEHSFWVAMYNDVFAGEKKIFEYNYPLGGKMRYFQTSLNPIYEGEIVTGASAMSIEISNIKYAEEEVRKINQELEQRVEERTQDLSNSQDALLNLVEDLNEKSIQLENSAKLLESKNKELETFTYSVSHDLKAPLRGIDGYSHLLEDSHYHKLDVEGRKFVKTIREGTKQMNQLIEDLLAYSRLERSVYRTSSINANELVKNALAFLTNEIKDKKINLVVDVKNSFINGDYDGLSIALRNIIENAVKFSTKNEKPEIKISLKENLSSWLFKVEDNGIGFDMKFHDRIFEIFQRLNLPEQYPGTGIGLAMVKKSAERMGGKIWAESSPGKGAAFYLEMPKMH